MNRRILLLAGILAIAVAFFIVRFLAVLVSVTGIPQLVISGGEVNLSVSRMPILGAPPYNWREVGCWAAGVHGILPSNLNVTSLTWTAPRNMGNTPQDCQIEATVSSSLGPFTYSALHTQAVGPEPTPVSNLAAILGLNPAVGGETDDFVTVTWSHNLQNVDHFDIYKGVNAGLMSFLITVWPASCTLNCMYKDEDAPLGDGQSATYQVDAIGPGSTAGASRRGGAPPGPTVSVSGLSAPTMLYAAFSCPNSPCFRWEDNSSLETGYTIYLQDKDANGNLLQTYSLLASSPFVPITTCPPSLPAYTICVDATNVPCPVCQNESPRNRRLKVVAIRGVNESSRGAWGVLEDLTR